MINKIRNFILALLFCLAVFAAPALFFLQPREDFSPREKRYLAPLPELSAQSVVSGEFMQELGTYVADHFPGRELFVGLNAYYDLYSGRQSLKDYFLRDGRLFAVPVTEDRQALDDNLAAINGFCRDLAATGAHIPVDLMLVPSSGAVLLGDADYPDGEIIRYVYDRAEAGHVDLLSAFREAADPGSLYYRTDHHWTAEGAFQAACAYRSAVGLPGPAREDYTRQSYGPFYGSAYSASGLWLTEPDSLELWYSEKVLQVSNETGAVNNSVYYPERLEEQDMYTVYLDGNHSLVRIENLSGSGEDGNLLVIRDSFSNSLGCFLADLYDKVILVDLRYYKLPLTDLIMEEEISRVLIEYSVDNFLTDANLSFLSMDPAPLQQQLEEERRPPNYFAPPPTLDDAFFDGAYYLGDSVNGVLGIYCHENDRLPGATIATNALLSFREVAHEELGHLIYQGEFTTLPVILEDMQPRILIASMGCNDLAAAEAWYAEDMVVEFLELARSVYPDMPIFIQSIMPIRVGMTDFNQAEVDDFNNWLRDNAAVYDYCYIELDKYFKDEDGLLNEAYRYNDTHISLLGAPLWLEQLLNTDNYYNFPEQFYVEYDGATGLPVENGAAPAEQPEETPPPEEVRAETVLDRIYAQIREQTDGPDMLELNERTIISYLGLRPEDYLDGRFYLCANNLKADEIWLLELEDEAAAQAMLERAKARIEVKASSYDRYLPEESAVARRGIAMAKGNFVALLISPDAEQMREIFLAALD